MRLKVRRVVVENDGSGKSFVAADEAVSAIEVGQQQGISGSELWSTDMMPVDNSPEAGPEQKAGVVHKYHDYNFVGNGQGTTFRITQFEPGCRKICHRTESLDYDIVLTGSLDLECEGAETVRLEAGDVAIVRGAKHAWSNPGSAPAVIVFVMVDAQPVLAAGQALRTEIPPQ